MSSGKIQKIVIMMTASLFLLAAMVCSSGAGELKASYLYSLSNFTGVKPFSWAKVSLDETKNEIYAVYGDSITVFNDSGMEIFSMDYDPSLGLFQDVAIDSTGDILILTYKQTQFKITHCNYRGEPLAAIELKELPKEYATFAPNRMYLRDGRIYLANTNTMQIVITDLEGRFVKGIDLAALVGLSETERGDTGIGGLSFDREGGILFSVPATARVFHVTASGETKGFGKRGSAPGKFGVVAGIAMDNAGNYVVADILRCVVMIFDKNFVFVKEFGFRGFKPGNLIGPNDLVIDRSNKVYVSQLRKRGVSVYQISSD